MAKITINVSCIHCSRDDLELDNIMGTVILKCNYCGKITYPSIRKREGKVLLIVSDKED